jgi:hypothetical protein
MVKKLKNIQTLLKGSTDKKGAYNSTKIIHTDKIIKIIWENIYSINQYKENVQAEKLRNKKNP